MNCPRPSCDGGIVDGYCDVCGLAPIPRASEPETEAVRARPTLPSQEHAPMGPATPSVTPSAAISRGASTAHRRLGGGLVSVPTVASVDPEQAVLNNPQVPEHSRYCKRDSCGEPVGRSRDGEPGRTTGFCRKCRTPFSFAPKLTAGDLVGGQYEVVGCLAHGGLGWVYLARDRKVADRYVALKGLLDSDDESGKAAAIAERRFLAEVEHPNIVKIHNFVEHGGDGYIVMEYVNGVSLRSMLDTRRERNGGAPDPLPVGEAIAYCLEVLPALGHLHELGLLFCDFKPDNVIRTAHSLKLIDLGGVYRIGSGALDIYGTPGYQAPEIPQTGPTVSSDLFTVGRTLAVMSTDFAGFQASHRYSLPPQAEVPLYERFDSLYRFLERATALDPEARFRSAADMAGQLDGVLHEVAAASPEVGSNEPRTRTSSVFTPQARGANDRPDVGRLPAPIVDPEDPHAGLILTLSTTAPNDVVKHAATIADRSVELDLWQVRALIELRRVAEATAVLDAIDQRDRREWRTEWYRGVVAMSEGQPDDARGHFERVYRWLPGELGPKLAIAMAGEDDGDHAGAAQWYEIVSRTDRAFTVAAFGLARCRAELGDTVGAIEAFERVPETSRAYVESRIGQVDMLLCSNGAPSLDDAVRAADIVESLQLDDDARGRLSARVLETALDALTGGCAGRGGVLFGRTIAERDVRLGLEQTYRLLARRAASVDERVALVDRANQVRPRSLL
jgi:serine/threonine-protein kinase PknG